MRAILVMFDSLSREFLPPYELKGRKARQNRSPVREGRVAKRSTTMQRPAGADTTFLAEAVSVLTDLAAVYVPISRPHGLAHTCPGPDGPAGSVSCLWAKEARDAGDVRDDD